MMNEIITGIACCGIIFIVVSVVWVLAIMQKPEDGKRRRDAAYKQTDRGVCGHIAVRKNVLR